MSLRTVDGLQKRKDIWTNLLSSLRLCKPVVLEATRAYVIFMWQPYNECFYSRHWSRDVYYAFLVRSLDCSCYNKPQALPLDLGCAYRRVSRSCPGPVVGRNWKTPCLVSSRVHYMLRTTHWSVFRFFRFDLFDDLVSYLGHGFLRLMFMDLLFMLNPASSSNWLFA